MTNHVDHALLAERLEPADAELYSVIAKEYPNGNEFCGSWLARACEKRQVGFHPSKLSKLANLGLLDKLDSTQGGSRRCYQTCQTDAALADSIEQIRQAGVLLKAVIIPGNQSKEGQLIRAVAVPWFDIVKLIQQDPNIIYEIDWRNEL